MDQIKGWTRTSIVLTILLAASEMDLSDPSCVQKLQPLFGVLDKCWLVPVHVPFLIEMLFFLYTVLMFSKLLFAFALF